MKLPDINKDRQCLKTETHTFNYDDKSDLLNKLSQAAIILPQGWHGPAFMVLDNFDVILNWNNSLSYALSVAELAKQINHESPVLARSYTEKVGLNLNQIFEIQNILNSIGFDAGEPDGYSGLKTQMAIREYQLSHNMPADGYANLDLLNHLRRSFYY